MKVNPGLFKSVFILGMLFLFSFSSVFGQQTELTLSHPISLPTDFVRTTPVVGEIDVIAVMVEFQPDTNRLTSGTGIFGPTGFDGLPFLSNQEITYIDPLPHNQNYFEAHLEFARNYFQKASDDQLTINYQVLPTVIQLDNLMETYSPTGETFTLDQIAQLFQDVWTKADEQSAFEGIDLAALDPESTAFVIFHAGIGRDVELTGTSLDITPQDLPSIFLRENDLADLLDNPDFEGFSIDNGSFLVNNSMLIPRTQSRRGEDVTGAEFVFPLSINGLLTASIGSFLGLPDLFNTTNGQSGIGRFGLMDGAGIFNYNGLFPPEPSAWEKVYLGWETPFIVASDTDGLISLPAVSLDEPSTIAKVELSSTEYFLVENRHRDPFLADSISAEVTITTRRSSDGVLVEQTFTNFDEAFIFQESDFDSLLVPGTIVNVSNFDWGLPGGIDIGDDGEEDTDDDRHLNGGILIWHIDDAIVSQNIDRNAVNADETRRGVALEEGDGASDIGRDPGLLDNTPSFGYAYDFWWSDNNFRVITTTSTIDLNPENEFGPDTFPNTNSNSGAKSFFELYDFSDINPTMSFRIREVEPEDFVVEEVGYEQAEPADELFGFTDFYFTPFSTNNDTAPLNNYWSYFPLSLKVHQFEGDATPWLQIPSNLFMQYTRTDSFELIERVGGCFICIPNIIFQLHSQPIFADDIIIEPGVIYYSPNLYTLFYDNEDASYFPFESSYSINEIILETGFISSQNGEIFEFDFSTVSFDPRAAEILENTSGYEFRSEIIDGSFVGINGQTVSFVGENISDHLSSAENRLFAGTISSNRGNYYYLFEDGTFSIVDPSREDPIIEIFNEEKAEWPAIIDEGIIYRINRTESSIEGYNFNGAVVSGSPIYAPDGIQFIGTPLIADITGDNIQDILVVAQDDYSVNIYAYETNGNPIQGFPLYVGGAVGKDAQPIHPVIFEDVLYAISHTGDLRAWRLLNHTSTQWPGRYGENSYNKVSAYIEFFDDSNTNFSVLNKAETYNWPNPANETTNLRFELASPGGIVDITVIDYTGRIIFERTMQSFGGAPEEIQLNTRDWGSGAYFARIRANVQGRTESKIVKIGVVH